MLSYLRPHSRITLKYYKLLHLSELFLAVFCILLIHATYRRNPIYNSDDKLKEKGKLQENAR